MLRFDTAVVCIWLALITWIPFVKGDASAQRFISDAEIHSAIAWVLGTDPFLGDDLFRIRVQEGVVYLAGHVTTRWERARAERLVRQVEGVTAVVNDLSYSIFRERSVAQRTGAGRGYMPDRL